MLTAASRFQAYLVENARRAPVHREVGPFVMLIDPDDASPYRNYATPVPGAAIRPDDIGALVSAFAQAERRPRLEYVEDVFEPLAAQLALHGFEREAVVSLMQRSRGDAAPRVDGFVYELAREEADLLAAARVQNAAYGSGEPEEADLARLRRVTTEGGLVGLVREAASGRPACSGLCSIPRLGVSELAAVGTLEPYRRRGLASFIAAKLADSFAELRPGGLFLMAFPQEVGVYERAGFAVVAAIAHLSHPPT